MKSNPIQVMHSLRQLLPDGLIREDGASVIELALLLPVFLLMLAGAIDFGRAYYVAIEVSGAAEAGALYGTFNPTDTAGMQAAAKLDAKDVPGITSTAIYGCECSDGSSPVASCTSTPTCTNNVIRYVQVSTAATYVPIMIYPGIPASFALKAKSRMRSGQ